jgi:hypothetical protein
MLLRYGDVGDVFDQLNTWTENIDKGESPEKADAAAQAVKNQQDKEKGLAADKAGDSVWGGNSSSLPSWVLPAAAIGVGAVLLLAFALPKR